MIDMTAAPSNLKQVRESLGVTQEDVIRRSPHLKMRTYARAEAGKTRVRHDTAQAILTVINALLVEQGREPLNRVEDLGLDLF